MNLEGRNALITGASGGIGGAIAKRFASYGANLILVGTRAEALNQCAISIKEQNSQIQCVTLICNLSDSKAIAPLWLEAEKQLGKIDILVNNAGITKDGLAMRMKDEAWNEVIQTNLTAAFILTRLAVQSMLKYRYGRIINISSVVGHTGNAGQANYCAAKAGLEGMSRAIAKEIATRGITINCIAPGFITSAMTDILPENIKQQILGNIPMGRMGDPKEIADCATFIASDLSGYITGQTIHVNGGMYM